MLNDESFGENFSNDSDYDEEGTQIFEDTTNMLSSLKDVEVKEPTEISFMTERKKLR
jgi:alanine dehydrogenase